MKRFVALIILATLLLSCGCQSEPLSDETFMEKVLERLEFTEEDEFTYDNSGAGEYELADFDYDERIECNRNNFDNKMKNAMADFSDEIKDLVYKAITYQQLIAGGTDEFPFRDELFNGGTRPKISHYLDKSAKRGYITYFATGVNFDSFITELRTAFTDEKLLRELFNYRATIDLIKYPFFRCYNNEVYVAVVSSGGYGIVHTDFETIEHTDKKIDILKTDYYVDIGDDLVYDSEKKDEYRKTYDHWIFINTENGWRADEIFGWGPR